jgi:hypothetical protein
VGRKSSPVFYFPSLAYHLKHKRFWFFTSGLKVYLFFSNSKWGQKYKIEISNILSQFQLSLAVVSAVSAKAPICWLYIACESLKVRLFTCFGPRQTIMQSARCSLHINEVNNGWIVRSRICFPISRAIKASSYVTISSFSAWVVIALITILAPTVRHWANSS